MKKLIAPFFIAAWVVLFSAFLTQAAIIPGGGGSGGVSSLNKLTGDITINGNCTVTTSTGQITLTCSTASGTVTLVHAGNSFVGVAQVGTDATITPQSVLSVASNSAAGGIDFTKATGSAITAVLHSLNISQLTNDSGYIKFAPATTTLTASGTATGPAIAIATSTALNKFTVVCSVATCTFFMPSNLGFFTNDLGYQTTSTIYTSGPITGTGAPGSPVSCPTCQVTSTVNTDPTLTGNGSAASLLSIASPMTVVVSTTQATSTQFTQPNIGSAIVLATAGRFGAYAGTGPCALGNFMTTLSAVGAQTCAQALIPSNNLSDVGSTTIALNNLAAPGAQGNLLTSNGTSWSSQPPPQNGDLDFYFATSSAGVASNQLMQVSPFATLSTTTASTLSNGTTSVQLFMTATNTPSLAFIAPGLLDVHIDAAQTAGTKPTFLYAVINEVNAAGAFVGTIATTENGAVLTGSLTDYDLLVSLSEPYTFASTSSRVQVNIIASVSGALLAPTVQIYYGGTSADSRLDLPGQSITNYVSSYNGQSGPVTGVSAINTATGTVTTGFGLSTSGQTVQASSSFASSTPTFNLYDATTTRPYNYQAWLVPATLLLRQVECTEFATSATNTIDLYVATSKSSLATDAADLVAQLQCGAGTSTASFASSTLYQGEYIVASTTAIAGTPSWTVIGIQGQKQ